MSQSDVREIKLIGWLIVAHQAIAIDYDVVAGLCLLNATYLAFLWAKA